ncbi:MAG: single-stranded DNA-binding protein, partial [Synergistales bacterium]|nr:single-stranded DNA-binding protein [Synergistales bacterium]
RYLKKGSPVLVEGRIQVRSYEAKDGSGKRYATDVVASGVTFLGSKRQDDSSSGSFGDDEGYGDSVRKDRRFSSQDEDFPMDISEVRNEEDADIPF